MANWERISTNTYQILVQEPTYHNSQGYAHRDHFKDPFKSSRYRSLPAQGKRCSILALYEQWNQRSGN
jgi:hypothetical protein